MRLILGTRMLDRAYARLDHWRSRLILLLASDAVLDRFNEWTYSRAAVYNPSSADFRARLFPWEEDVITRFFAPPPARVLVGGAGTGREAGALRELGYDVVAFEPARKLAEAMLVQDACAGVDVYRGGYEDLPVIVRVTDGAIADLRELGPFDAAIFGWGSFSHIRTHELRIAALERFAEVAVGPLLASFLLLKPESPPSRRSRARLRRLARHGRDPEDRFSMYTGFGHPTNTREIETLASVADLEILELSFTAGDSLAPYAVFRGRAGSRRQLTGADENPTTGAGTGPGRRS